MIWIGSGEKVGEKKPQKVTRRRLKSALQAFFRNVIAKVYIVFVLSQSYL